MRRADRATMRAATSEIAAEEYVPHRSHHRPYFERGDCTVATRTRVWSDECPRCQEVPGAGVCPAPGTLSDFVLSFNHTYVLCFGPATCPRHRRGYWPRAVHERMTVIDGRDLDRALARRVGPRVAAILGIDAAAAAATAAAPPSNSLNMSRSGAFPTRELRKARYKKLPNWVPIVRHRVLALLATLRVVELAHAAGRPHALILEGDVRPVPAHALGRDDLLELRAHLATQPWEVVRPSGYFFDFARGRNAKGAKCPAQCRCRPAITTARPAGRPHGRFCEVRRAMVRGGTAAGHRAAQDVDTERAVTNAAASPSPTMLTRLDARCDVRDTVGFAVSARTYPAFRKLRRTALASLAHALELDEATTAALTLPTRKASRGRLAGGLAPGAATPDGSEQAAEPPPPLKLPANSTLGWPEDVYNARLPWFDKWLPARFHTLYVLPSLVVQQVRQGDIVTSVAFRDKCQVA